MKKRNEIYRLAKDADQVDEAWIYSPESVVSLSRFDADCQDVAQATMVRPDWLAALFFGDPFCGVVYVCEDGTITEHDMTKLENIWDSIPPQWLMRHHPLESPDFWRTVMNMYRTKPYDEP